MKCDVAIIGGGPAGSTVGSILKKYNPSLEVVIVEREQFPRDHVGESQLPAISNILDEIGVWDEVERANFPIKIGATYRWGRTDDLWDFEFLPGVRFQNEDRPAKFVGQRRETAFQVDRSIYDKILLDHAKNLGCNVLELVKAAQIQKDGDRITSLALVPEEGSAALSEPTKLEAKYYVDASGEGGTLRRAMGVEVSAPTALRNIAIWDYWNDADWAVTLGQGGTRIQVMSLGWGWIWFIPITPTRTSIGLVLPAQYYLGTGKSKESLYAEALQGEPLVSKLIKNATQEGAVKATKDWNFLSERLYGENWFLAGDSCGFADPILSAGMTLAHSGSRAVAYTILELERGEHDSTWLKEQYQTSQKNQIRQHMMFADYWYSANGRFTDLKEYCSEIAATSGLDLDAEAAFRWLSTGGFTNEVPGVARVGGFQLNAIKMITQHFSGGSAKFEFTKYNKFSLITEGVKMEASAALQNGRVIPVQTLRKGEHTLPLVAAFMVMHHCLNKECNVERIFDLGMRILRDMKFFPTDQQNFFRLADALEVMVLEGWVEPESDPSQPLLNIPVPTESDAIHPNRDNVIPS